jgi:hypothetical protein
MIAAPARRDSMLGGLEAGYSDPGLG